MDRQSPPSKTVMNIPTSQEPQDSGNLLPPDIALAHRPMELGPD